jgi:very-short-patch-repair endonuclease
MAAALWVRSDSKTSGNSCTSHTTAAYLLGLCARTLPIHVSTPRPLKSPTGSIVVHRTCLDPVDVAISRGIPITTPAKTLLDLGAVLSIDDVESALETGLRRGTVSLTRLHSQIERYGGPGHRGSAAVRALLSDRNKGYIPSESELEVRFFRIVRRARLPLPVRQKVIKHEGRFIARVDFAYPDRGLVIEVHGWKYHGAKNRWEHDHERGNELTLTGVRTLEYSWRDITKRPNYVLDGLRRSFAAFPGAQGSLLPNRRVAPG